MLHTSSPAWKNTINHDYSCLYDPRHTKKYFDQMWGHINPSDVKVYCWFCVQSNVLNQVEQCCCTFLHTPVYHRNYSADMTAHTYFCKIYVELHKH